MKNVTQTNKADIVLNTYALAKASWLEDDFVSSFVPMAASLINERGYEVIQADSFAIDFENMYAMKLPSQPTIKLLSILQKRNLIVFDEEMRVWKPCSTELRKFDLTAKKMHLQNGIEKVYNEIVIHAKTQFDESLNADEAKELFYSFVQANSAEVLNGELNGDNSSFKSRSLIGSFISYTKENNVELFEIVKQLTIGRLLVDAITMLEFDESSDDFKETKFYIDTRFFLYLIGFYGEYRENASINLIDKLLAKKAFFCIFKHNYDEINYTLSGCAKWIDSTAYDPEKASSALRYLKSCGKDRKYVEALIASIPSKLKRFQITIDNESWFTDDPTLQTDRHELRNIIKTCYEHNDIIITERVEETIENDIASVESIYYQRKGNETYNINEKNIFLLTTNRNLVYACKKYHNNH